MTRNKTFEHLLLYTDNTDYRYYLRVPINKSLYGCYLDCVAEDTTWDILPGDIFNEVYYQLTKIHAEINPEHQVYKRYIESTATFFNSDKAAEIVYCMVYALIIVRSNKTEEDDYFLKAISPFTEKSAYFKFFEAFIDSYPPTLISFHPTPIPVSELLNEYPIESKADDWLIDTCFLDADFILKQLARYKFQEDQKMFLETILAIEKKNGFPHNTAFDDFDRMIESRAVRKQVEKNEPGQIREDDLYTLKLKYRMDGLSRQLANVLIERNSLEREIRGLKIENARLEEENATLNTYTADVPKLQDLYVIQDDNVKLSRKLERATAHIKQLVIETGSLAKLDKTDPLVNKAVASILSSVSRAAQGYSIPVYKIKRYLETQEHDRSIFNAIIKMLIDVSDDRHLKEIKDIHYSPKQKKSRTIVNVNNGGAYNDIHDNQHPTINSK